MTNATWKNSCVIVGKNASNMSRIQIYLKKTRLIKHYSSQRQSVRPYSEYIHLLLKTYRSQKASKDRKGLLNSVGDVESSCKLEPTLSPLGPTSPFVGYGETEKGS